MVWGSVLTRKPSFSRSATTRLRASKRSSPAYAPAASVMRPSSSITFTCGRLWRELCGDAGMVGTGKIQGVVAAHATPAHGGVDHSVIQHVAHVQRAGDVGRRDHEREIRTGRFGFGVKDTGLNPPFGPMRLEALGFVDLVELHGKFQFSKEGVVDRDLTGFAGVWCNEEVPARDTP